MSGTQHIHTANSTKSAFVINQQGTGRSLEIQDNGTAVVSVLDGGFVGIGTTNPSAMLHVNGDIQCPALVGQVAYFAMNTAPTGWLKCNGSAISRVTYVALFTAVGTTFGVGNGTTTFAIPDLRGEFVRGWDDARGIDTGRAFASSQAAEMLDHTHTGTTGPSGSHNHSVYARRTTTINSFSGIQGANGLDPGYTNLYTDPTSTEPNHTHTITTGNPSTGGGTETRPRNIALLACIKY